MLSEAEREWLAVLYVACNTGDMQKELYPVPPRIQGVLGAVQDMAFQGPSSAKDMIPDIVSEFKKQMGGDDEPWKGEG